MFATPDQITEAVLSRFNERTGEMGFGAHSQAHLPVKVSDLKEPTGRGGDSGFPVSRCRHLCIYVIAQHCVAENPYTGAIKPLSYPAIGSVFNKSHPAVRYSILQACQLLSEQVYTEVYQSALDDINAKGLELWRAKYTRVECSQ